MRDKQNIKIVRKVVVGTELPSCGVGIHKLTHYLHLCITNIILFLSGPSASAGSAWISVSVSLRGKNPRGDEANRVGGAVVDKRDGHFCFQAECEGMDSHKRAHDKATNHNHTAVTLMCHVKARFCPLLFMFSGFQSAFFTAGCKMWEHLLWKRSINWWNDFKKMQNILSFKDFHVWSFAGFPAQIWSRTNQDIWRHNIGTF